MMLTPKEKAEELVIEYGGIIGYHQGLSGGDKDVKKALAFAKKCALFCVDEKIETLNLVFGDGKGERSQEDYECLIYLYSYYKEVKSEIEKL